MEILEIFPGPIILQCNDIGENSFGTINTIPFDRTTIGNAFYAEEYCGMPSKGSFRSEFRKESLSILPIE